MGLNLIPALVRIRIEEGSRDEPVLASMVSISNMAATGGTEEPGGKCIGMHISSQIIDTGRRDEFRCDSRW